ncbi:LysM peptidoglycan-binding domain-containing protein [Crassaminicella thermophila]|uniref:LysM peptidoglycan-binding domain-containing protein n=1 Tax=Crassaminicella thermophila TaxID=2599308 RepID=A0A5C0SA84_CRATE|nr:LysM peptidoglycan-binding domain-containing protein [Crassaminicella thermophila]QEK11483.1 LysM peptidoglycan-binding domain-containing protein [Crassaminicella thermophila]
MKFKKLFISSILGTSLFLGSMGISYGQNLTYTVQSGDVFWKIAQKYNVSTKALMEANNADENTIIYPGQSLIIPSNEKIHIVKPGDTYWIISQKYGVSFKELLKYNGADENTYLDIGQAVKIPSDSQKPYVTYITHTVKNGDDFWKLSLQYGIPMYELLEVNGMDENTWLTIGQKIRIPVHHVPIKPTPANKYGEYLDWWTEAQYVLPIGAKFTLVDFETGKRWNMKRTIGANHADCEPLTKIDAAIMKGVWGGQFSWERRAVIVEYNGRKIAASAASMPHSIQYINDNNFNGHMDVHFANSTRHKDGKIDWEHQKNIKIAAGIK